MKDIKDKIVVITGASSGIGRAAALEFAREGAKVVVGARRLNKLEEVVAEIEKRGSEGLAVQTDVTQEDQVCRLAQEALNKYGHFDIWVNDAAVMAMGKFENIPADVFRKVIETNFFGTVYGSHVALSVFKKQKEGIIINVSSVDGTIAQPFSIPYTSSKFAVQGFSEALRLEAAEDGIEVCTVIPASIDTPIFQHTANYSGKVVNPLQPLYAPQQVAEAIVGLALTPKREVKVGTAAKFISLTHAMTPGMSEKALAEQAKHDYFSDTNAKDSTGNVFEPSDDDYTITGDWKGRA